MLPSTLPPVLSFCGQIEQKMLESAQNLLKVCQTESKQEKLREAVRSHYANVRKLKRSIKESRGQWRSSCTGPARGEAIVCSPRGFSCGSHNVSFLFHSITAERDVMASQQTFSPPPPSPPPPPHSNPTPAIPEVPPDPLEQQRSKVIEELLFTERDYHHQMQLCCSKVLPGLSRVSHTQ